MAADFTDLHPDFAGFSRTYQAEVQPVLRDLEANRRQAFSRFQTRAAYAIAAGFVVAVAVFFLLRVPAIALVAGVAAAGALGYLAYKPVMQINQRAYDFVLERLLDVIDLTYTRKISKPVGFETFERFKLLAHHDRASFEDMLTGNRHGADFYIYEAHLEQRHRNSKGRDTWTTCFRGQLMKIDYPSAFEGKTVIAREVGFLNSFSRPGNGYYRVGMASPRFEKQFEVWSTDQVEARDLLDPVVLERFIELEALFQGKNPRAVFADGALYLAIETGDVLKRGSSLQALDSEERIVDILKEFAAIYDLIDVLIKPVSGRIEGTFTRDDLHRDNDDDRAD